MRIEDYWYGANHPLSLMLAPLGWLYRGAVALRRGAYRVGLLKSRRLPVPVIVVGNITVGGTGKTPLVIELTRLLKARGFSPGVVARGYRGQAAHWPQQARPDSDSVMVGDEAIVVARRTLCPVAVGPDRVVAARALLQHHPCDVLVSDDGLQHLALGRDIEIAVVDGTRRHGNRRCLPAGPLREPVSRLRQVDLIVTNGIAGAEEFPMKYVLGMPRSLLDGSRKRAFEEFMGDEVHAIAGIGNPEQFFAALRRQGLAVIAHPFPDHHAFARGDIEFGDGRPVLMTEKDAVKCQGFAGPEHWFVPVEAELPPAFEQKLFSLLNQRRNGQETT